MRKKSTHALLATLAAGALLSSCALTQDGGEDPEEQVTVEGEITGEISLQTWSLKPKFTDYIEGVIAAFEAENPGTTVEWLDQPGEGYAEKVLSQASAGDLPDVTNLPPDFALPLAKEGALVNLEEVDESLAETYVPGALEAYQYAGLEGTFGYPWYLTTDLNYWNSELMAAHGLDASNPPTNLDELIEQARTYQENATDGTYLISRQPGLGDLANAGVPILNEDGTECTFNTPEAVELLDVYRDAYAEGLLPQDVLTGDYLGNSQLFTSGEVAWSTGGGNFIAGVLENNPSLEGSIVPSHYMGTPPLYVQGVSVPRSSENLPTAIAFAQFLTNPENQEAFAQLVPGIFPSTTASQDNPAFSESDGTPGSDATVIAFSSLPEAEMFPPVQVPGAMTTIITQQFSAAIAGDITSQEALDTAVERCTALLADQ